MAYWPPRNIFGHAYKHVEAIQATDYRFELLKWNISKTDLPATSYFHFVFLLVFLNHWIQPLCMLILFISIEWCGILSFLTHYPVYPYQCRHPAWFFSPLRFDVLSMCSFNFLSSVHKKMSQNKNTNWGNNSSSTVRLWLIMWKRFNS